MLNSSSSEAAEPELGVAHILPSADQRPSSDQWSGVGGQNAPGAVEEASLAVSPAAA